MKRGLAIILICAATMLHWGCTRETGKKNQADAAISGNIIVFHAGSLSVPMKALAGQFQESYPGVNILLESAGSMACARKITELHKPCDIMASSDYAVIENLLIPGHTGWHIPFATNEMVIAYEPHAALSDEINTFNWKEILALPQVRFGRADPNSDPCGYRTILVIALAFENIEQQKELLAKDTRFIRPKEVDLLALLEVGEIDYIFIYRSVADQHGLKYVLLSDNVNLKDPAKADQYARVSVKVQGEKPGDSLTVTGEPMVYALTRLNNAPNPGAADAFLEFILGNEGRRICSENGLSPFTGAAVSFFNAVPEKFRNYVIRK